MGRMNEKEIPSSLHTERERDHAQDGGEAQGTGREGARPEEGAGSHREGAGGSRREDQGDREEEEGSMSAVLLEVSEVLQKQGEIQDSLHDAGHQQRQVCVCVFVCVFLHIWEHLLINRRSMLY